MMQKRLLSLLLITVAVLGIGLILTQRQQPIVEGVSESGPLVPGLSNELNDIKALRITGAGNALIAELTRKDSGWVVSNRHDYPADFDKVREYLLKLADAKLREAKTSKPENYARLGVEDLAGAEAKGLGVELIGTKAPVKLIVGIASGGGSPGTFVRRADEAASYLVSGDVIPDKEGANWLARQIMDLPSSEVYSVAVTAPDKSVLKIDKPDASQFNYNVASVPKGRELSSESAANIIAGALSSVTLEDALPIAEATPDPASTWTAQYLSYDGFAVDTTVWDKDAKTWATFAAHVDEAQLDAWLAKEQAKADAARATAEAEAAAKAESASKASEGAKDDNATDTAQAEPSKDGADADSATADAPPLPPAFDAEKTKADKRAELDKRVAELNEKTAPWAYAIPNWKAANIKKKMDDLLKPKS
ncbi:MAG: DUF4340 domain-containing protein [Rhodanobacteraceae bacterium]|nr:DUF4340 domain-containing protein [Rhodanobacteraceae bacterium]